MSLELQESISSFVDDELDAGTCEALLSHFDDNEEQKQRISRYGIISAAMKGNLSTPVKPDFLAGIHAKLADEPPLVSHTEHGVQSEKEEAEIVSLPIRTTKSDRFHPIVGYGIAATVTLAAVLSFQMFTISEDVVQPPFLANNAAPETQKISIPAPLSRPIVVASTGNVVVELPTVSENRVYAQQSLIDDGQWTRITPAADTPLQLPSLTRHLEGHVPFVFQPRHSTFAQPVNLGGASQ